MNPGRFNQLTGGEGITELEQRRHNRSHVENPDGGAADP